METLRLHLLKWLAAVCLLLWTVAAPGVAEAQCPCTCPSGLTACPANAVCSSSASSCDCGTTCGTATCPSNHALQFTVACGAGLNQALCRRTNCPTLFTVTSCAPGFAGSSCQFSNAITCNGNGTAQATGTCLCNPGFLGESCNACAPNYVNYPNCTFCQAATTCSGNGTCSSTGACTCRTGFIGANCSTCASGRFGPSCAECPGGAANPCGGFGTCSSGITGAGTCTCAAGYSGADCLSPTIAAAVPNRPATLGGTTVTISGRLFGTSGTVRINGVPAPTTSWTTDSIQVTFLPGQGTVSVSVERASDGRTSTAFLVTYAEPSVNTIDPASVHVGGGARLRITGSNFGSSGTVTVGTGLCDVQDWTNTQILCVAPAQPVGSANVTVNVGGQLSAPRTVDYALCPAGRQSVNGLCSPCPTGTYNPAGTADSQTCLTCPTGTFAEQTGAIACTPCAGAGVAEGGRAYLCNDLGVCDTSSGSGVCVCNEGYRGAVCTSPSITSVTAPSRPITGGTQLTINGNFLGSFGAVTVGDVFCTSPTFSQTQVTCTLPPGTGTVDVVVTRLPDAQTSNAFPISYDPPVLSSVAPSTGNLEGGTVLSVTGLNFATTAEVRVDDALCPRLAGGTGTRFSCTLPAGDAPGAVPLVVVNPGGSRSNPLLFTYTVCPEGTRLDRTTGDCIACDPGTFSNSLNALACLQCGSGTFTDTAGAVACQQCAPGTIPDTPTGATACSECPPGRYANAGDLSCSVCDPGTFAATSGQRACLLCEPGTFAPRPESIACLDCEPGTFAAIPGSAECLDCEPGTFSAMPGSPTCSLCPDGFVTTTLGRNTCTACPAGTVSSNDGTRCEDCPAGTYTDVDGLPACLTCAPGTYAPVPRSLACLSCPAPGVSDGLTCYTCGNGIVEGTEQCDEGEQNSDTARDACRTSCVPASCGDGTLDSGEGCDQGEAASALCTADCALPTCGDGNLDTGEACDDGDANSDIDPDSCRTTCVLPYCGDGTLDARELCDNGPDNRLELPGGCDTTCGVLPICGDGYVDADESCDDGADNSDTRADACRTSCEPPRCGDGVVDSGEACEPALDAECLATCTFSVVVADEDPDAESDAGTDADAADGEDTVDTADPDPVDADLEVTDADTSTGPDDTFVDELIFDDTGFPADVVDPIDSDSPEDVEPDEVAIDDVERDSTLPDSATSDAPASDVVSDVLAPDIGENGGELSNDGSDSGCTAAPSSSRLPLGAGWAAALSLLGLWVLRRR